MKTVRIARASSFISGVLNIMFEQAFTGQL
jgi:hypothetical protein